jgi:hypothetical protein
LHTSTFSSEFKAAAVERRFGMNGVVFDSMEDGNEHVVL